MHTRNESISRTENRRTATAASLLRPNLDSAPTSCETSLARSGNAARQTSEVHARPLHRPQRTPLAALGDVPGRPCTVHAGCSHSLPCSRAGVGGAHRSSEVRGGSAAQSDFVTYKRDCLLAAAFFHALLFPAKMAREGTLLLSAFRRLPIVRGRGEGRQVATVSEAAVLTQRHRARARPVIVALFPLKTGLG